MLKMQKELLLADEKIANDIEKREKNNNTQCTMYKQASKLFLYQLSTWIASIYACGFYFYFIVTGSHTWAQKSHGGEDIRSKYSGFGWICMWYWQFIIAFSIIIVMPIAMRTSLHKKAVLVFK